MPPSGFKRRPVQRWAVVRGTNDTKGKKGIKKGTPRGTAPRRKVSATAPINMYPKGLSRAPIGCLTQTRVYVLELRGGFVYVGKTSRGVRERLSEHMRKGSRFLPGAAFTKLHLPTGRLLPRLGNLEGDGDGPERNETLRQMHSRGARQVRGWKYVRPGPLTMQELADIEGNIRELFDLCRRCGQAGHFTLQCRSSSKASVARARVNLRKKYATSNGSMRKNCAAGCSKKKGVPSKNSTQLPKSIAKKNNGKKKAGKK